jgi:ankyrin repeat protein
MQDGHTPAIVASSKGQTETLALLLANEADVNSADKVHQFKLLSCLLFIYNKFEDKDIFVSYYPQFKYIKT